MSKKQQQIELLMKQINKKQGDGTLVKASEVGVIGRFPTGSLALDVILGGGWPANQWHEIVGEYSSGKTTLAYHTVAACQKADPEHMTLWIAAEEFVGQFADDAGIDRSRVVLYENNIMEDVYELMLTAAESRNFDLVVLDSLPALVPATEDEKLVEESTVGRGALITNKFFRKAGAATKRSMVDSADPPFLGLIINQWRMKIGVMYGDPRTTPGGLGKDFAFFTRVDVRRAGWLESGTGDAKVKVGQEIRFRTIKNKSAPPERVAAVDFYFAPADGHAAGTFDTAKEIFALGIYYGIIKRGGAYYSYGDIRIMGKDAMLAELRSDLTLSDMLAKEVLSVSGAMRGPVTLEEESDED